MDEAVVDVQSLYEKQTKIHAREVKKAGNQSSVAQVLRCFLLTWPMSTCTGRYADKGNCLLYRVSDRIV